MIEGWVVAKADFYTDASGNYLSDTCERRRGACVWGQEPLCCGAGYTTSLAHRRLILCASPRCVPPPSSLPSGKEYSKADSRYASRDAFIIAMEVRGSLLCYARCAGTLRCAVPVALRWTGLPLHTSSLLPLRLPPLTHLATLLQPTHSHPPTHSMQAITAFLWGPLCPLLVWGILGAKPWRYALMLIVSVGQIYGDVLYYGTCYLEGAAGGSAGRLRLRGLVEAACPQRVGGLGCIGRDGRHHAATWLLLLHLALLQ